MRKLKYGILISIILILLLLTACQNKDDNNKEEVITGEVIQITPDGGDNLNEKIDLTNKDDVKEKEDSFTPNMLRVEKYEGDLIQLKPDAYDPDGDVITYTFSTPFNNDGEWQTEEGDEGEYIVTITASDGKLSTSEDILIVIKPTNKAPIVDCPTDMSFKEGTTVVIDCEITDPEGTEVLVEYSGWMESAEKKAGYDDAGEYSVTLKATDGERTTVKELMITIENVNRAPTVEKLEDLTIQETETVNVEVMSSDNDGDETTVEFFDPLNNEGSWETTYGDAGEYKTHILVSDGQAVVKKEFTIIVTQINTPPSLEFIEPIVVDEGETIELPINTFDREGDKLTIEISGWFTTETYTTNYEDAGDYIVTVSVSDGELTTTQDVEITVNDMNRPPIFKIAA